MVKIEKERGEIVVRVLGWHALWAFKRELRFTATKLVSAELAETTLRPPWFRCPGTQIPRVFVAGTYRGKGRKEFWDTRFKGKAIQLDFRDSAHTRLVVDVADPPAALAMLRGK